MRSITHSYIFLHFFCLLTCLPAVVGCSDEVPRNGTGEEWVPVRLSETVITDITVCEPATKSSDRKLPPEVQTTFDTGDQLILTYTLNSTELTATATKTGEGWEIKDNANLPFKLPADFTGDIVATTPDQTPATISYQTNKLKATCSPVYDTASKTFTLSFSFSQESAGIQVDVSILSGVPTSVQLAYEETGGATPQYVEIGTSARFTKTSFFDAEGSFQITGFRIEVNDSKIDKTFDTPLTLTKGTFYFIDLFIADINDLTPSI